MVVIYERTSFVKELQDKPQYFFISTLMPTFLHLVVNSELIVLDSPNKEIIVRECRKLSHFLNTSILSVYITYGIICLHIHMYIHTSCVRDIVRVQLKFYLSIIARLCSFLQYSFASNEDVVMLNNLKPSSVITLLNKEIIEM